VVKCSNLHSEFSYLPRLRNTNDTIGVGILYSAGGRYHIEKTNGAVRLQEYRSSAFSKEVLFQPRAKVQKLLAMIEHCILFFGEWTPRPPYRRTPKLALAKAPVQPGVIEDCDI
jgi:hypothetical protein